MKKLLALLVLVSGCAVDPVVKTYADRVQAQDDVIYKQSEWFASLADPRAYVDPTTRPAVDPVIIDQHLDAIKGGRDLTSQFQKYTNVK